MIPRAQTYEFHPSGGIYYWFTCGFAVVFGITACFLSFRTFDGRWVVMVLGILFAVCGVAMFVRPQTIVESSARIVRRESRLFGRFPISSRNYPFSDFTAVVVKHVRRTNFGEDPDQFYVYLRRKSERQLLVRYFEADDRRQCRPAHELAHTLSSDLGIEIDDRQA